MADKMSSAGAICPECGNLCRDIAMFCDACGTKLDVGICSECGTVLRQGAKFCDRCGHKLSEGSSHSGTRADEALKADAHVSELPSGELLVGSYVKFGKYPQNNGSVPEPIEWQILENDGKTVLVVSKYGLDSHPYHGTSTNINWRDCDLRKWLNSEFINQAFSSDERERIAESTVSTEECGETQDKVFCLSEMEARKFFVSDIARKCLLTPYAMSRNAKKSDDGYCWYWLRSPGSYACLAAGVNSFGEVNGTGVMVYDDHYSVRPALRIKI